MVNINVIGDIISVSVGSEQATVPFDKKLYKKLSRLADEANESDTMEQFNTLAEVILQTVEENQVSADAVVTTQCDWLMYNPQKNQYFLRYENQVISEYPMPESFVDRIMESIDKDIDFMPVVKLWTRFMRNPNLAKKGAEFAERFADFVNMKYVQPGLYNDYIEQGYSDEMATQFATVYQIKITKEGLLNGYKVSTEVLHKYDAETGERVDRYKRTFNVNTGEIESEGLPEFVEDRVFEPAVMGNRGDAFYCGDTKGHIIKVGQVHALESWDQVNCNDRQVCVPGLHIGGLYYINGYSGEIHNVFVDPMHIGAIPDSTDGAIRCKQYFVHSSLVGVNGSMYHSSEYAKLTDEEWDDMRVEIFEQSKLKKEKIDKELNTLMNM